MIQKASIQDRVSREDAIIAACPKHGVTGPFPAGGGAPAGH
jgi:hypothetical protein